MLKSLKYFLLPAVGSNVTDCGLMSHAYSGLFTREVDPSFCVAFQSAPSDLQQTESLLLATVRSSLSHAGQVLMLSDT